MLVDVVVVADTAAVAVAVDIVVVAVTAAAATAYMRCCVCRGVPTCWT